MKRAAETRTTDCKLFLQLVGTTESSSFLGDRPLTAARGGSLTAGEEAEVNHFLSSLPNANLGFSH